MLLPKLFVVCREGKLLIVGAVQQGEGGLFVYTTFTDACTEGVYDVLEYIFSI